MSPIETHFDMLLDEQEQARIGATRDKPENMRVMRLLSAYAELREDNAALRAELDRVQDERAASFARLGKAVGGISLTEYQPEVDLEIEAAIKALRADKERMDWLEDQCRPWPCKIVREVVFDVGKTVRAAIDAARAALGMEESQ